MTHPDGMDLRMTWPERQLELRRLHYRRGLHAYADTVLPYLPDFIARCGGRMPMEARAVAETEFARRLEEHWNRHLQFRRNLSPEVAEMLLNGDARWAYHVEWWEYEGRRVYVLDPVTAHALLHTTVDEFPTEMLRFPVRSFFIRIPRDLGWQYDLREFPNLVSSVPDMKDHPEPVQEIDGVHVTLDGPTERPDRLQLVVAGRSVRGVDADHLMWSEVSLQPPTLGEVLAQTLTATDRAEGADEIIVRKIIGLVLGTVLYITSSHPELRAVAPVSASGLAKALKDPDPKRRARAAERSRYAIMYVGGPTQSFRKADGDGKPEDLSRKPPRPHVRTGHFRHVWLGARDSAERRSEVRWIQPVTVGSWDRVAAYNAEKGYRYVIRKTRPAEMIHPPGPALVP